MLFRFLSIIFAILCFMPTMKAQDTFIVSDEIKRKADMFYLDAVNERLKNNHAEAFELYHHVLEIYPEHVAANYDMSSYYHALGNSSKSGNMLKTAAQNDPQNYWVNMGLVQLYASTGDKDKALETLEDMAKVYPANSTIMFMLEDLYLNKQDYDKVIDVLNRLELHEGENTPIAMEKVRIYRMMGKNQDAMKVLQKLDEDNPADVRYKVMIGDLYLDDRKYDQAFAIYNEMYEKDPDQLSVLLALAKYYETIHNTKKYNEVLGEIVINSALSDDIRLSVMQEIVSTNLFGQQQNDTTAVMLLFDEILKLPQEDTQMAELCARYMISSDMSKERIKPVLYQMLQIDAEADIARNQLLLYAIEEDSDEDVRRLCKTAVDYSSENAMYYYYLGVVELREKNFQSAIDACQKGITKLDKSSNIDMVVNMYAVIGDSYHFTGKNSKAYEYYDSCLLYKPNNVPVLNNYAYYLALEKKNLKKAEEMAKKAIEIEKDNPTYIDTYAWVLFQQQRYEDAKVYIDMMIDLLNGDYTKRHTTLLEHAGDIYSKCKLKDKALDFWKKSKELGSNSTTIDKKIRQKRYFEY